MLPEVLGGLTEGLLGLVGGFLIAYFVFRLQGHRKIIEYEVMSMPLLRFSPRAESTLSVTVDKSAMTGRNDDRGVQVPVKSVYGFEITVVNVGNVAIEDPTVEVYLDTKAEILEYQIPSPRPGYLIATHTDMSVRNEIRFSPPYINSHETLVLRVISTGNATRGCLVNVLGVGIQSRSRPSDRKALLKCALGTLLPALVLAVVSSLLHQIPGPLAAALGGRQQTVTTMIAHFPWWVEAPWIAAFLALCIEGATRAWRITGRSLRETRRSWD
jgi:hypothetical protein